MIARLFVDAELDRRLAVTVCEREGVRPDLFATGVGEVDRAERPVRVDQELPGRSHLDRLCARRADIGGGHDASRLEAIAYEEHRHVEGWG